ncbi:hypothetical protein M0M57_05075 [Flavobacterium azooxidireducens]|uniref:DUF4129 domain-containing protein n=1 Tax=Flavobacterium azooxidireducens TaxID=1871076 RepID=A0ABY4KHC3_9FLAO|nr:hypothetical protein [Flavobacterium azooxidireducens]UPQ80208.1 hypothetical protein M0M57_05075 [Flavobacterium azooxidireducens]
MKKYAILLVMLSLISSAKTKDTIYYTPRETKIQSNIILPEKLKIEQVSNKSDSLFDKSLPWISALFIGIISAIINFYIAHKLRKSNERNLERQLASNERNFQLQIEASKEIKILEIRSNIGTKNRQDWLNDLTQTLSEYLSSVSLIVPKLEIEELKPLIYRASLSKAKLELLLSQEKAEQKRLFDSIQKIYNICVERETIENHTSQLVKARTEVIESARELFKFHWSKIKNP